MTRVMSRKSSDLGDYTRSSTLRTILLEAWHVTAMCPIWTLNDLTHWSSPRRVYEPSVAFPFAISPSQQINKNVPWLLDRPHE